VGTLTRVGLHNYGAGAFKRIYATVTGAATTEYRLWADNVPMANTIYSGTIVAATLATSTLLPSTEWVMPPTGLRGLRKMPNGIMVGFVDNNVCFSEPFLPHAWPIAYRQSVPVAIVGIGGFGTTLVIGTKAQPYTINGIEPASMGGGANLIEQPWPCLSKRGMTSADWGVLYPTTLGLALIGPGGADLATTSLYTEEEWRPLNAASFVASVLGSLYLAAYTARDAVTRQMIMCNKGEFSDLLVANFSVDEVWTDPTSGVLYVSKDGVIYRWDDPDQPKTLFDWFSKDALLGPPKNFAAAKLDADFTTTPAQQAAAVAANAVSAAANQVLINTDLYESAYGLLPIGEIEIGGDLMQYPVVVAYEALQFQLYADNKLVFVKTVTSGLGFKLPSGFKKDTVAVRVTGNVLVRGVVLGESMADLRGS
jgi:hypothetical protein